MRIGKNFLALKAFARTRLAGMKRVRVLRAILCAIHYVRACVRVTRKINKISKNDGYPKKYQNFGVSLHRISKLNMGKIGLILTGIALYAYKKAEEDIQYFQGLQRDIQNAIDMQCYIPGSNNDGYITENEIKNGTELERLPEVQKVEKNEDIEEKIKCFLLAKSNTPYSSPLRTKDRNYKMGVDFSLYLYPNEKKEIKIRNLQVAIKNTKGVLFSDEVNSEFVLKPNGRKDLSFLNEYIYGTGDKAIQKVIDDIKEKYGAFKCHAVYSGIVEADIYYEWTYTITTTEFSDKNKYDTDLPFVNIKGIGDIRKPSLIDDWKVCALQGIPVNIETIYDEWLYY